MSWKRRMRRNLLVALLGGAGATAIYWGLLFTTGLHSFAAGMLGPAAFFVLRHDPRCFPSRCAMEELIVNATLYAFWIMIVPVGIDTLLLLKRRLAH
jgi:hypothetical protein